MADSTRTADKPFDIRMNCLHLAQSLLSEKMHMTKEVKGNAEVTLFTTDDVLREAGRLYAFVCDKNADETYTAKGGK